MTNYLLVNLSIADLLITWLCIPLQVNKSKLGFCNKSNSQMTVTAMQWFPYGRSLCYLLRSWLVGQTKLGAASDCLTGTSYT